MNEKKKRKQAVTVTFPRNLMKYFLANPTILCIVSKGILTITLYCEKSYKFIY